MTNRQFLESMGFFERDGWLCNPYLGGEAVFQINSKTYPFENKSLNWLLEVITATAQNAGSRFGRVDERKKLGKEVSRKLKSIFD